MEGTNSTRQHVVMHLRWALTFFFLSGMTGLVYEVLWTRRLSLIFGHTVLAVSTVVACYMTGLGLGSYIAGGISDRRAAHKRGNFLAGYGILELFIGLWAFLSVPLLNLVEKGYVALSTQGAGGLLLHLACLGGAMLVLVPPTTAMGATLPVMSRLLILEHSAVGALLSRLYGLNTLGAFCGAGLAGFVLLPKLGSFNSLVVTALTNIVIGVLALWLGRSARAQQVEEQTPEESSQEPLGERQARHPLWLIPLAFALAGVSSMGFQIAWTRGLALSLGSSTYAFTTILTTFLAGIGLGSLLYSRLMGSRVPSLKHLASVMTGIGLTGGLSIPLVGTLPLLFLYVMERFRLVDKGLFAVLAADVGLAAMLLFAPTLLMGLAFPLANQLYTQNLAGLGKSVGRIYGANTLGCIAGSVLAGFVGVPYIGAQWTLKLAALCSLLVGLGLFLAHSPARTRLAQGLTVLFAVAIAALPSWDPGLMSGGVALYANRYLSSEQREFPQPAWYRDGLSATVSVGMVPNGEIYLKVNGKADASTSRGDLSTQYLSGYIPALYHPNPKQSFVLGLGGGQTVEALATMPGMERVDVAELEPAVVEADKYFQAHNDYVLDDPRVHIQATDGRTALLGAPRLYDVILSEPSNPWIAGIGNLYTRDFYQIAADRLAPGGVMCQWFNLYAASWEEVQLVLNTYYSVFPHGETWMSSYGDLLLLGSLTKLEMKPERVREVWSSNPEIQADFFRINLYTPENLFGQYLFSREHFMKQFGRAYYNTDDLPRLEYSAPYNLYGPSHMADVLKRLFALSETAPAFRPLTPENIFKLAQGWVNIQKVEGLPDIVLDLQSAQSALLTAQFATRLADFEKGKLEARARYAKAVEMEPENYLAWTLAAFHEALYSEPGQAVKLFEKALENPPPGSEPALTLGAIRQYLDTGSLSEAERLLKTLPDDKTVWPESYVLRGKLLQLQKNPEEAMKAYQKALDYDSTAIRALFGQVDCALALGKPEQAIEIYDQALKLRPDDQPALVNQAVLYTQTGQPDKARANLKAVLKVNPANKKAQEYLNLLQ